MSKRVYLIRHAESLYNIAEATVQASFKESEAVKSYFQSEEYLSLKFNLEYEDCDITEKGFKQCEECRQKMAQRDVDLVIVSPLRRALSTCHEVFKGHKSNPAIIVDPTFREIMESSCDIGSKLEMGVSDFPEMDFSLIERPHMWYVQQLQFYEDRQKIEKQISKEASIAEQGIQAKNATLNFLKQNWEDRKKDESLKAHVLPSISDQKNHLRELFLKYDSIAVVTHSENIKSYIGEKPKNCQIFEYLPSYLDLNIKEIPISYL